MRQGLSKMAPRLAAAAIMLTLAACNNTGESPPAASSDADAKAAETPRSDAGGAITIALNLTTDTGLGDPIGTVTLRETPHGLVFEPALQGLPPGLHGFHVHENGTCEPKDKEGKPEPAGGAGGHYDPGKTGAHGAPWGEGHAGDLPPLYVDSDGKATQPVLAPRLKIAELKQHALMIHGGGDNHADQPAPLGGGAARIACGVIS